MPERTGLLDHTDLPPLPTEYQVGVGTAQATIVDARLATNQKTETVEALITYQLDTPIQQHGATAGTMLAAGTKLDPQRLKLKPGEKETGNTEFDRRDMGFIFRHVLGVTGGVPDPKVEDYLHQLIGKPVTVLLTADERESGTFQRFKKVAKRNGPPATPSTP